MLRAWRPLLKQVAVDVAVIGGGPGGYVCAIKAAQLGLKVACIEKDPTLGGTCLNVGCIPSKALLNATHHYHFAKHEAKRYGVTVADVGMDFAAMHAAKKDTVKKLTSGIAGLFRKAGVVSVAGKGRLTSPTTVEVDDGTTVTASKAIVIATGSSPIPLPFAPFDETAIVSSTGALAFPTPPKRLCVVGGGVVGLELGSVWSRIGSTVSVVEFSPTICPFLDADVAVELAKQLKGQGIAIATGRKVTAATKTASGAVTLRTEAAAGGDAKDEEFDTVLVSVGRRAFTEGLGLEAVGVEVDKRGCVVVDAATLRTKVAGVYAIGDCVNVGPMLAHKASDEGVAVAETIAGKKGAVDYNAIPGVIYTSPEVAWVGLTEADARKQCKTVKAAKFPYLANSRAKTNIDTAGFVKVVTDSSTDKLLGAHIVCANAGEAIAEFVLALSYGASSEDIARTCHAHPTLSEAIREACMAAYDKPLHF